MERTSANQRFLMREIASGSQVAFAELFDQLGAETYRICLEYLPRRHDAEYATLCIWLYVWQNASLLCGRAYNPSVTIMETAEHHARYHARDHEAFAPRQPWAADLIELQTAS